MNAVLEARKTTAILPTAVEANLTTRKESDTQRGDANQRESTTQRERAPNQIDRNRISPSWVEKLTVSCSGFGFATTMFIFSALVMIPNASRFMHSIYVSEPIQQVVVLFLMFGLPLLAAMYGIRLGSKAIFAKPLHD